MAAPAIAAAGDAVLRLVRTFHEQQPISEGLPREEARTRVFRGVEPAIFEAAMRRLVVAKAIVDRERLALPSHKASLPGGEETVAKVAEAYREAGLTPPDRAAIAERAGVSPDVTEAADGLPGTPKDAGPARYPGGAPGGAGSVEGGDGDPQGRGRGRDGAD